MIQQTINELWKLKEHMESMNEFYSQDELFTLNKAIIACEQLKKARKKAKRWKRKYLDLLEDSKVIESDFREMWELWVSKGGAE